MPVSKLGSLFRGQAGGTRAARKLCYGVTARLDFLSSQTITKPPTPAVMELEKLDGETSKKRQGAN
jgi:hypothetical protein